MDHEWVALFASVCSTVSFIPQVYKTWKTKKVSDFSLTMLFLLISGIIGWFTYGIIIGSTSMIISNFIIIAMIFYILYIKIKHNIFQ